MSKVGKLKDNAPSIIVGIIIGFVISVIIAITTSTMSAPSSDYVSDDMIDNLYDFVTEMVQDEVFDANDVTGVKFEKKDVAEYEQIGKNTYRVTGVAYDVNKPTDRMEYKVVVTTGNDTDDKSQYEYSWFLY